MNRSFQKFLILLTSLALFHCDGRNQNSNHASANTGTKTVRNNPEEPSDTPPSDGTGYPKFSTSFSNNGRTRTRTEYDQYGQKAAVTETTTHADGSESQTTSCFFPSPPPSADAFSSAEAQKDPNIPYLAVKFPGRKEAHMFEWGNAKSVLGIIDGFGKTGSGGASMLGRLKYDESLRDFSITVDDYRFSETKISYKGDSNNCEVNEKESPDGHGKLLDFNCSKAEPSFSGVLYIPKTPATLPSIASNQNHWTSKRRL